MKFAPQLTAEDFKNVHNGKCSLHNAIQRLDGVINDAVMKELVKAYELINQGLKGAYEEEAAEYQRSWDVCQRLSEDHGFSSIWSIHEVKDFTEVPFPEARAVTYTQHWGKPVDVLLPANPTWLDLWKAADVLIKRSGDSHHVYIEDFKPRKENSFILELSTGS